MSGIIMMKIELKSRNFEKLQRFSAFSGAENAFFSISNLENAKKSEQT